MAIYKNPLLSGTHVYRTKKSFKNKRHIFNMTFGEVVPVFAKFVLPGDIWKPKLNAFIRYMPTLAPILTECNAYFRFFFVPLRQVEDKTEEVITGSKGGSLITSELPKFKNFVKEYLDIADLTHADGHCAVHKYSFWSSLGIRPNKHEHVEIPPSTEYDIYENYDAEKDASDFPAAYWYKAYCKIIWEYFRDENYQSFDGDFNKFYEYMLCSNHNSEVTENAWFFNDTDYAKLQSYEDTYGVKNFKLWFANINKDYFMSALPWIMKGVQPTINSVMHADFTSAVGLGSVNSYPLGVNNGHFSSGTIDNNGMVNTNAYYDNEIKAALNNNTITDGGFTAQDIRDMFAETRVFERLARCGSRYVEYLESNFGIAPRDDTLQRPLYLGGFSQPIVTTEVVQTGEGSNPVGTMRGHGISSGGNSIKPFVATEFGMFFALMYVKPKTQYLYQINRELTYNSRFDFFNPSFQLLSEQQVNNVEFFTPRLDIDDSETPADLKFWKCNPIPRFVLGYQGMYNELRYDNDLITRDMADNLSYWTQAINPNIDEEGEIRTTTPPLNGQNISVGAYMSSLLRPFEAQNGDFRPMICDIGLGGCVYRPMVKDPIPSLTDHN